MPYVSVKVVYTPVGRYSTLQYDYSDEQGHYEIKLPKTIAGAITLNVHSLGYKTKRVALQLIKGQRHYILDFKLDLQAIKLKEVIIRDKPYRGKIQGDTVIYNVDQYRNAYQQTLKDLLEALPGIKVEDGAIKFMGKQVQHLLIGGDELFKEGQHSMAVENIPALMIDSIYVMKRYEKNKLKQRFFGHGEALALNLSIKEEFKNRIVGNLKGKLGYPNQYVFTPNLFRLGGDIKASVIGTVNNINKKENYSKRISKISKRFYSDKKDEIKEKKRISVHANFLRNNKKRKTEGYLIFEQRDITKEYNTYYSVLGDDGLYEAYKQERDDENKKLNLGIFNYNFSVENNNSSIETDNDFSWGVYKTNNQTKLNSGAYFLFKNRFPNVTLKNKTSYHKQLSENFLLSIQGDYNTSNSPKSEQWASNYPFLRLDFGSISDQYTAMQHWELMNKNWGIKTQLFYRKKKLVVNYDISYKWYGQYHTQNIILNDTQTALNDFRRKHATIHSDIMGKLSLNFADISLGGHIKNITGNNQQLALHTFIFNLSAGLKLNLFNGYNISFNYNPSTELIGQISQLYPFNWISNFDILIEPSSVIWNQIYNKNTYSISQNFLDINKGISFFSIVTFTDKNRAIISNVDYDTAERHISYSIDNSGNVDSLFGLGEFQKIFYDLYFTIALGLTYSENEFIESVEGIQYHYKNSNLQSKYSIFSDFSNPIFNFSVGLEHTQGRTQNNTLNSSLSYETKKYFFRFKSKINQEIFFSGEYAVKVENSLTLKNKKQTIGLTLLYNKKNSRWSFDVSVIDLELGNNESIINTYRQGSYKQVLYENMRNQILVGVKYKIL